MERELVYRTLHCHSSGTLVYSAPENRICGTDNSAGVCLVIADAPQENSGESQSFAVVVVVVVVVGGGGGCGESYFDGLDGIDCKKGAFVIVVDRQPIQ